MPWVGDVEAGQNLSLGLGDLGWECLGGPVVAMVAERRGRSWLMTLAMARAVRSWMLWATARAVTTIVRWALMASQVRWNIGRARRSLLDIRNERSIRHNSW